MRNRLISLLAAAIGSAVWLMLIGPILIYEYFSDKKWRLANGNKE